MAKNVTLRMPIQRAYGVEDYQISSGVKWLSSDAYNIEAKVDASVAERLRKVTREQRRIEQQPRLQHLLAERWKLELYHETKELPVYALVIAKGGFKMQEAKPGDSDANAIKSRGNVVRPGNMEFGWGLRGRVVSIAYLARMLSRQHWGSPVVHTTGLKGTYDFTLKWTPDQEGSSVSKETVTGQDVDESSSVGPSLFVAIQAQLGLKLKSQRAPVDILVIDHVEKPSEN